MQDNFLLQPAHNILLEIPSRDGKALYVYENLKSVSYNDYITSFLNKKDPHDITTERVFSTLATTIREFP